MPKRVFHGLEYLVLQPNLFVCTLGHIDLVLGYTGHEWALWEKGNQPSTMTVFPTRDEATEWLASEVAGPPPGPFLLV